MLTTGAQIRVIRGNVGRNVMQMGSQGEGKPKNKRSRTRVIGEAYSMDYQQEQRVLLASV